MARWTALCLVLALTATSASRLTCVWECIEVQGEAHAAAACHETPASGPVLTASESHCPLTPDGTAIWTAKGSEPQRLRGTLDVARQPLPFESTIATVPLDFIGLPLHHARGAALRTNSVLRI